MCGKIGNNRGTHTQIEKNISRAALMHIPKWLSNRPISHDDPLELRQLFLKEEANFFSDISVETVKEVYHKYPGDIFYKLIRILGFCGVQFYNKLSAYSGPLEPYPDVLCISSGHGEDRLSCILNDTDWTPFFRTYGIHTLKQLHGVPIENFIRLSKHPFTCDQVVSILPASITTVHDDFFVNRPTGTTEYKITAEADNQNPNEVNQPPEGYSHISHDNKQLSEPIENLRLSVRSLNCLLSVDINYIGELVGKRDEELIAIPHLGEKSFREIKKRLSRIGLHTGMPLERLIEPEKVSEDPLFLVKVDTLDLSVRSKNCLRQANINTVSDLRSKTDEELLSIPNFGRRSLWEIQGELKSLGIGPKPNIVPRFILQADDRQQIDLNLEKIIKKLKTKVSDLILSVRSRGCLRQKNIQFVWQLTQLTEKELRETRNLGRRSINELREAMEGLGFWLGMKFTPEELSRINTYEPAPEPFVLCESIKNVVRALNSSPLDFLNDRENLVVSERLFKVGRKQTLEEIAHHVSLTRERVRQIEKSAINKIKQHHLKDLRAVAANVKQRVNQAGGLISLEELEIDIHDFGSRERIVAGCLLQMMEEALFIDWEFSLVSTKGEDWILALCDAIQKNIIETVPDKFFTEHDLIEAAEKAIVSFGISSNQCQQNLINRFYLEKEVTVLDNHLCCGRVTKQDKIILAFKEFFPDGLEVYKKQDLLIQRLIEFEPKKFCNTTPRAIVARLATHPDVFLWRRGFFIHKDHVSYDEEIVEKVAAWIEQRFDKGHSRFQVDVPFNMFRDDLQQGGVPNQYALYTLLRLQANKRIGQRKFPTLVDLEADVDIYEGILEELESYFLEAQQAVPYSQLKEEFIIKRGWKEYSLNQNISSHSELIFPWQGNSYIHFEYMNIDYGKLEELLEALRAKLNVIQGAYSLKGAKKEMNVLWEQVCSSASVRTMIKLIRSVDPEDLQIEHYFIQFADPSTESVSAVAELEEFFLDKRIELNTYELHEEFCAQRGWSENQFYGAIRKARVLRSSKSTFLHPTTIGWSEIFSQEVHQVLEAHLAVRNKNRYPHMQIEELIYQYVLPELPQDIQWTRHLLKSVGEEFGDFIFFDDAYIAADNEFDIEDLDDMIGFLVGHYFRLGISKRAEVEQMLWREGILESGRAIPADQFFEESSIVFLQDSNEVGLSQIGWEIYGCSI